MPDTYTTNYNLTRPEPNASRDTWGSKTNDNWTKIDNALKALSSALDGKAAVSHTHTGYLTEVPMYKGTSVTNTDFPIGTYLACNLGSSVYNRNASVPIRYSNDGNSGYNVSQGTLLTGTWRQRGIWSHELNVNSCLCQRTA